MKRVWACQLSLLLFLVLLACGCGSSELPSGVYQDSVASTSFLLIYPDGDYVQRSRAPGLFSDALRKGYEVTNPGRVYFKGFFHPGSYEHESGGEDCSVVFRGGKIWITENLEKPNEILHVYKRIGPLTKEDHELLANLKRARGET